VSDRRRSSFTPTYVGPGSKAVVIPCICVGAGKILGVRKIYAQISSNVPKNTPKKMTSKNKTKNECISFHVGRISSDQSTSTTTFAEILPKLAQIFP